MIKKSLAVILMFSMLLSSFTMVSAQEEASSEEYTMELLPAADAFISLDGDPAFTKMTNAGAIQADIYPAGPYSVFCFNPAYIPAGVTSATFDLSFRVADVGEMTFKVYEYGAAMDDGTLWTNETANTTDIGLPDISTANLIGSGKFTSDTVWGAGVKTVTIPIDPAYLSKNMAFFVQVDYAKTKDNGTNHDSIRIFTTEANSALYSPKLKVEYTLSAEDIEKVDTLPAADAFVSLDGDPAFTKMTNAGAIQADIYPAGPYPVFRFDTSYIPSGVMSATFDLSFRAAAVGEMTFKVYEYGAAMDDGTLWTNETANTTDIGLPDISTANLIGSKEFTSDTEWQAGGVKTVTIPIDPAYLSGKKNTAFLVQVDYAKTKDNGTNHESTRIFTTEANSALYSPKLKVEYILSAEEIETSALSTVADAGLNFGGDEENKYAQMSSGTGTYIDSYPDGPYMITRFDASSVPGNVRAGSLKLSFWTSYQGEMTFNVYEYGAAMDGGTMWTDDLSGNTSDIGLPDCVDVGFDTPIASEKLVTEDAVWNGVHTVEVNIAPQYLSDDDISLLVHVDYEATKENGGHEVTRFITREANNGYEAKLELKTSYEEIIDLGYTYDNGSSDELLNGLKNVNINKSYVITGKDINPDDILFVLALYDITSGGERTLELAETEFAVDGNKLSLSIDLTNIDLDNKELNCFLWEKETLAPMVPKGQPLR